MSKEGKRRNLNRSTDRGTANVAQDGPQRKLQYRETRSGTENDAARDPWLAHSEKGPEYWRSLEERTQAAEFRAWLDQEFPVLADKLQEAERRSSASRRQFLRLMAASMALAGASGLTGCRRPAEKILPYGQKPEEIVPGQPLYYATTMVLAGASLGLLVETHEGRPTKVEGHPRHPLSQGATDL